MNHAHEIQKTLSFGQVVNYKLIFKTYNNYIQNMADSILLTEDLKRKNHSARNQILYYTVTIPLYFYMGSMAWQGLVLLGKGWARTSDDFRSFRYNYNLCLTDYDYKELNSEECKYYNEQLTIGFFVSWIDFILNNLKWCAGYHCTDVIQNVADNTWLLVLGFLYIIASSGQIFKSIWNWTRNSELRRMEKVLKKTKFEEEEELPEAKVFYEEFPPVYENQYYEKVQEEEELPNSQLQRNC